MDKSGNQLNQVIQDSLYNTFLPNFLLVISPILIGGIIFAVLVSVLQKFISSRKLFQGVKSLLTFLYIVAMAVFIPVVLKHLKL